MNQPHFTFAGLVRLGRHVLASFIERHPDAAKEVYACWRSELPGIVPMQLAPEYWDWQLQNFDGPDARVRFSGFMDYVVTNLPKPQPRVLDLRHLMPRIEMLAPSAKPADRKPMLALYWIFTELIPADARPPGRDAFLARWESDLDECSIELLAARVISDHNLPWPVETCVRVFEQYQRSRHKATATRLPRLLEIAIVTEIANILLASNQTNDYEAWLDCAIFDTPGDKVNQNYLRDCRKMRRRVDPQHILGRSPPKNACDGGRGAIMPPITEEEIRLRAYSKWADAGKSPGDGIAFWFQAEKELLASRQAE
jgi:hypothetical protein